MTDSSTTKSHKNKPTAKAAMKGTAQVLFFQVITLLCNFSQLFLAQRLWGDQGLSLFTQWRRLSALLIPLMLLGHGIALARELGRAHDLPQKRVDIVASSFSFISTILLAVGMAMILLPEITAKYVLGSSEMAGISGALGMGVMAQGLATLMATFMRGRFRFLNAAILQLLVIGVVPAVGILACGNLSPGLGIWLISLGQIAVAGAPVIFVFARFKKYENKIVMKTMIRENWLLTRYGVARMPILVSAAVLNGFGSWQMARSGEIVDLGIFNSLNSLAHATGIVSAAIAFTLLPILSAFLKQGNKVAAAKAMSILIHASVAVSLFLGLQLFVFGPSVAKIILPRSDFDVTSLIWGGIFLTIVGRFINGIIRNPLDAYSAIPYQLISYLVGSGVLFGVWFWCKSLGWPTLNSLVMAYVASFSIMAIASVILAAIIFRTNLWNTRNILGLLLVILLGGVSFAERAVVQHNIYMGVVWLGVNTLLFGAAIWFVKVPWFIGIINKIRPASSKG